MNDNSVSLTQEDLETFAAPIFGGPVEDLPLDKLKALITSSQFITDTLLNEFERRGELESFMGSPVIPYHSNHMVDTILTRP